VCTGTHAALSSPGQVVFGKSVAQISADWKVDEVDNLENLSHTVFAMPMTLEKGGGKAKLLSREQALVDEFASVIRRHRVQAPTTLARLIKAAFDLCIGPRQSREDKLARAVIRGLEARQQLAEAEGGSLSSEEAARLLGISKTAVLKRLEGGRLLAWREERLQAARFPRWQFDEHGRVLAGLEGVLEVLNQDERLDAWAKVLFFLQEKSRLEHRRPLDLLREGKRKEVRLAAQAYAE
jgi:predicted transcriptional regulator